MIKSFEDLEVYQLSYSVANEIFLIRREFPKEELYSLSSQIIRSSRSISSNIAEGWARRTYELMLRIKYEGSIFLSEILVASCLSGPNFNDFFLPQRPKDTKNHDVRNISYENKFKLQPIDSLGSNAETLNWIRFAKDCGYINELAYNDFSLKPDQIGKMPTKLHQNWRIFKSSDSNIQLPTSDL